MPFAQRDGVRLYWRMEGTGEKPVLMLLNSIGTDMDLWRPMLQDLLPAFRLLRMDTRGHGASDAPDGDYSLAMLALDAIAVMDHAGVARAMVAGVSLGGMIAMQLAADQPDRVSALALIRTSAQMDRNAWSDRVAMVRSQGTVAIADMAVARFLSTEFAAARPDVAQDLKQGIVAQPDKGYAGCGAAIRDMDLASRLREISMPTLVVTGCGDRSTPFEGHGDRLMAALPQAMHVELDGGHLPPVEVPASLASLLRRILLPTPAVTAAEDMLFATGLDNRRRILGDKWVDASLAKRTPFNSDFQAMITRIAWHEIWGRPGLDDRTRRLIVIAITASLGRWEEFGLHVRAGLSRLGFTRDELREVLMQAAIYAGVPAANTAFAEAAKIIAELDEEEDHA